MNIGDMLGAVARRWYVVVAGVLLAAAAAYGLWTTVPPEYTRSSTQLLLPGPATIPDGSNPFLFVGGLSQAADVLVRTVGSTDTIGAVTDEHPEAKISVARDPLSSGPVVLITVTSPDDAEAGLVMDELVAQTATTLTRLQIAEGIASDERITVIPLAVDEKGVVQQKNRIVAAGAGAAAVLAVTLIAVAILDSVLRSRAHRRGRDAGASPDDRGDPPGDDREAVEGDAAAVVVAIAEPAEPETVPSDLDPAVAPRREPVVAQASAGKPIEAPAAADDRARSETVTPHGNRRKPTRASASSRRR
jgi:hypothetical protein